MMVELKLVQGRWKKKLISSFRGSDKHGEEEEEEEDRQLTMRYFSFLFTSVILWTYQEPFF